MKFTIEQARAISGMTQVEMAAKLGMSEKTYIQYEKYRKVFRMDTAARFVELVKLGMNDVIFFQQEVQKICS
ncbi:helix-turn-helix transcriptional regulator [Paenibacillus alvei]|uniref:helix-turn-helix transcriptional regulator n=1 Tax=Paenibacillus alvei TaxID=44250 RepID=UPI002281EEAC|nr:helix-turn-helix transcriptional regulator [Paenibacillus alvei]MCY7486377.1 helix-turn-helix domain-containing protein [Paenibacillus alvei]